MESVYLAPGSAAYLFVLFVLILSSFLFAWQGPGLFHFRFPLSAYLPWPAGSIGSFWSPESLPSTSYSTVFTLDSLHMGGITKCVRTAPPSHHWLMPYDSKLTLD